MTPYRFTLSRTWSAAAPLVFVMLNPSTADETNDDPTIRRCVSFAKREGAGGLLVVNLSPWRSTDPADLRKAYTQGHDVLAFAENRQVLSTAFTAGRVVLAWGAGIQHWMRGQADFAAQRECFCLGLTKRGEPRHPLMLRADQPLVRV